MDINIRESIINNFKGASDDEIKVSIVESIKDNKEITLPGLGVFFELLWINCDDFMKEKILAAIKKGI
ncbi:MAG: small acid-soluble spore protein SspI [Bacilli bacterium]|nr:small acid-soluble spore protein SspI [Bacilli bacterium]